MWKKIKDNDDADDDRRRLQIQVRIALKKDLRNGVGSDFVSISIKILYQTIVGPLMGNEKRRSDFASVRISSLTCIEKCFKDLVVNVVNRILECDEN